MNIFKIITLKLRNFKGQKEISFSPKGHNMDIAGENGTGKTTVSDAFYWQIKGQDSTGKSDFQLKPVDKDNNEVHHLETEVEGLYLFNDKEISLRKRFKEKWTKKKGTATQEFSGHTTDYFIDDVPTKKGEFDEFIKTIAHPDVFKLVSDPQAFNNLHWQQRREIIVEVCGDVVKENVINSDPKLMPLMSLLADCTLDDHKKKVAARKREINKELELIPARLDEVILSLQKVGNPNPAFSIEAEKEIQALEEELRVLKSNEFVSKKQIEVNELTNKILKAQSGNYDANQERLAPIRTRINNLELRKSDAELKIHKLEREIKEEEARNKTTKFAMDSLKEKFIRERDKEVDNETQCPACGQDLPQDKMAAAIEEFNDAKAESLRKNNEDGLALGLNLKERTKVIEQLMKDIITAKAELKKVDQKLENNKATLESNSSEEIKVDTSDLEKEKEELKAVIKDLTSGTEEAEMVIQDQITGQKLIVSEFEKQKAEYQVSKNSERRKTELEEQMQALAEMYEKLEKESYLIDRFIVKQVELMEERINSKFKLARFKMFNILVNGGVEPCCETTYLGVPFSHGLNSASQTNVGVDIANTLSEFYQFTAPMWVDNKESVNELIDTTAQVITLTVSKDKKLTIS